MFSYIQVFTSAVFFFSRSGLLQAFIAQGTSNDSFFHLFWTPSENDSGLKLSVPTACLIYLPQRP